MHIQTALRTKPGQAPTGGAADLLTAMQPAAVTYYPPDAVIYAQGEAAGPLYFVEFGTVRICRLTADGRRHISAFHMAGEVFGFEAGNGREAYAESVDGAGVRTLRTACGEFPAGNLLALALRNLARTEHHLMVLGRRTAAERMAALLVDLAERQGDETQVHLPMQRYDIADYLGLTFETVSRLLRGLKEQGVIRLRSTSDVEILDIGALRDMCE
jgi:CRP/FNR family nitrogen fixation transcriptional regulator